MGFHRADKVRNVPVSEAPVPSEYLGGLCWVGFGQFGGYFACGESGEVYWRQLYAFFESVDEFPYLLSEGDGLCSLVCGGAAQAAEVCS
jgi:hypothetical protein